MSTTTTTADLPAISTAIAAATSTTPALITANPDMVKKIGMPGNRNELRGLKLIVMMELQTEVARFGYAKNKHADSDRSLQG